MQTIHDTEEPATMSHDSSQPRVPSLFNDKGSLTLNELMFYCTTLSKKVAEIAKLLKEDSTKLPYIQEDAETQGRTSADTEILLEQEDPTELVEDLVVVKRVKKKLVLLRRSAEKRKDKGKAIMKDDESVQKKTKKQLEQEKLGHKEAIRLQEQINKEERQRIARDAEIAK
ncbi:hypothetical protein Tco_0333369 [Tanacetum coccineum]